jgi:hypothetical protein
MRDPHLRAMAKCLVCDRRSPRVAVFRYGVADYFWAPTYAIGDSIIWNLEPESTSPSLSVDGRAAVGRYMVGCWLRSKVGSIPSAQCDYCMLPTEQQLLGWANHSGVIELMDNRIVDVYFGHAKLARPDYCG